MLTYVNGHLASTVKAGELCKDGQHSIKRRVALFWSKDAEANGEVFIYTRSVAVHAVVLDAEQVRRSDHACRTCGKRWNR